MENDKKCSRNKAGDFGGITNPLWVGLKVWHVWEVLGRPKVTKF